MNICPRRRCMNICQECFVISRGALHSLNFIDSALSHSTVSHSFALAPLLGHYSWLGYERGPALGSYDGDLPVG